MENQNTTINLTFIQRIAIFYIRNIDNSSFKMLQAIALPLRILFYICFIAFVFYGMSFISSIVSLDDMPGAGIFIFLGTILFYGVIAGSALILTIESVIKLDVVLILNDLKQKKQYIKLHKLERLRLRTMNLFVRIILYIFLYIFILFIIQISTYAAFFDIFALVPNTLETKQQVAAFIAEYDTFLRWFSFSYLTSFIILDYFVTKKRVQRKKEVQHENA